MTSLQPGQMLGPYQITAQIGKGGMATVYKAYQPAMDRYVALKVVATQLTDDPTFMQRFRQEARLIAKLEHPRILPVHDFGEADGTPYMVMRFLDAGTLKERLDAGQLPLPEIDRIFSQLTDALEYAHENGVIHRDIKPSNAMLDKRGDVFLTDFGIAKMAEGSSGLTATGAITGTPAYMSPEQAQGLKVDQRSDIYSLGVVLFEMLTGRVPFEAETPMAVLFKQIQDPPPPLSLVRPDLPYTLEPVLLKALAKDLHTRYASMAEFRAEWKRALAEAADSPLPSAPAPEIARSAPAAPATRLAHESAPAVPQTPVKKDFNWKLLAVEIFVCIAIVFCIGTALLYFFLGPGSSLLAFGSGPTQTPQISSTSTPRLNEIPLTSEPSQQAPGGDLHVRSWAAANSVYSLAFRGDEILAAGIGGLTTWTGSTGDYRQYTTADGLPSPNLNVVFIDHDGSVWIGTDAGIVYGKDNQNAMYTTDQGLDTNYVVCITRSGDRLLAGTQYSGVTGGGLLEFSGNGWKALPNFPSADDPNDQQVSDNVNRIVTDHAGKLWVATDSGIAMLDKNNQWHVFNAASGLPDENVHTIYVNPDGNLFAGTANGMVARFNEERGVFENYHDLNEMDIYDVNDMLTQPDGTEWYVGGNVARHKVDTDEWTRFSADNGSIPLYSIRTIGMNDQGILYFGSDENGLARYVNGKFETLLVPNMPHIGRFGDILPAPDGTLIFVQVYGDGADRFDPASGTWTRTPDEQYTPRAFDAQGRMWSGGWNGLWIFSPDKTTHLTADHGLPSEWVGDIVFGSDGSAYIATGAGIAVFDGLNVTDVYTADKNGLAAEEIHALFMASDGSLWAAANGGFNRRLPDGTWESFTAQGLFDGYSDEFPDFAEDQDGNIWVATMGDGLYRFADGKWQRMLSTDPSVGLPGDYLTSVTVAPDGALWIGTDGNGAVRYDGKTWQRYGVQDGLINDKVYDIYVEPGGVVWFATDGGVTRLEP